MKIVRETEAGERKDLRVFREISMSEVKDFEIMVACSMNGEMIFRLVTSTVRERLQEKFTRNLEDVSTRYADAIKKMPED